MSKTGKGLEKMYALATLTNLAHDTAALRIQMAFRGFVARKSTEKRKTKLLFTSKTSYQWNNPPTMNEHVEICAGNDKSDGKRMECVIEFFPF